MLQIVDKIKLPNWLRWPQYHQKASNGENLDLTNVIGGNDDLNQKTRQPTSSRGGIHYRHKNWISHLNPLHSERRSSADITDLQACNTRAGSQSGQQRTQVGKIIEAENKLKDDNKITILLGDRQQGILAVGTFKLNTGGKESRIQPIKVKHIHSAPGGFHSQVVKLQDEQTESGIMPEKVQAANKISDNAENPASLRCETSSNVINHLKNRALPPKSHPKIPVIQISGNQVEKRGKKYSDRNFDLTSPESFCDNSCRQKGPLVNAICHTSCATNRNALRTRRSDSSEDNNCTNGAETPDSSRISKWSKLRSHSTASQNGPHCPLPIRKNPTSEEKVRVRAGGRSISTTVSPRNSDKLGPLHEFGDQCCKRISACQWRRSCTLRSSSHGPGRWITTDSEYVVLEL